EYLNERLSGLRTENSVRSTLVRPYIEGRWKRDRWRINGGMAASYSALTGGVHFMPKFALIHHLPHQQKVAINTGLHRKLQPYQVLLSSDLHTELPMMQSWKSTFTYEKNFTNSAVKGTLFYEAIDQVAASPSGFSALNTLEEYPPAQLGSD